MAGKTILRAKRTFENNLSRFKGEERANRTVDTTAGMNSEVGVDTTLAPVNTTRGDMKRRLKNVGNERERQERDGMDGMGGKQ